MEVDVVVGGSVGALLPRLLGELLPETRGRACRLQNILLLDLRVQVGSVHRRLLGVEGLPRGDLRRQLVVVEALMH
jgi:hypothetical protein